MQIVNDTIYSICQVTDTIAPYKSIGLFEKLDQTGKVLSKEKFDIVNRTSIGINQNTLIKTNDGGFAYGGWTWGSTQTQNSILLLKYDSRGNYQWYKEVTDTNYLTFYCNAFLQDSSSNYYFAGSVTHKITKDEDIFISKTDSLGNLIYMKIFNDPLWDDGIQGICVNSKGHIIIGGSGSKYIPGDLSTFKSHMKVYELDTAGHVLNYVMNLDTNGPSAANILSLYDGGYLISNGSFCSKSVSLVSENGAIYKLDSAFNILWKTSLGPCSNNTGLLTLKSSSDSIYIATGVWFDSGDTLYNHKNGWIVKFTRSGHILWDKKYRGISSTDPTGDVNDFGSIGFLSNGDIIAAGEATINESIANNQQGWLLRLDTAGCLPDSNSCGIVDAIRQIPQNEMSIRLYPNPAFDRLYSNTAVENMGISVWDMTGRIYAVGISGWEIDISSLPAGIYCIKVQSNDGNAVRRFVKE